MYVPQQLSTLLQISQFFGRPYFDQQFTSQCNDIFSIRSGASFLLVFHKVLYGTIVQVVDRWNAVYMYSNKKKQKNLHSNFDFSSF